MQGEMTSMSWPQVASLLHSIIPLLFAAHTQATVYAVAERVSFLLESKSIPKVLTLFRRQLI